MAEELVRNFMQEMEDLGFQKGDIIDRIADYKEEEKMMQAILECKNLTKKIWEKDSPG